jgi:hypothetical protein
MLISEIKLYELLKERIGAGEAEAFIQILDTRVSQKFEEKKTELATKDDVAKVRIELMTEIGRVKTDLQKTIYLTSLGQLFAIVASVISLILVINK